MPYYSFHDSHYLLIRSNQKLKRDDSDNFDLSDNFSQLGDSIVQFVNEIDAVIMHKEHEVHSKSNKAKEQVSYADAEVARPVCIPALSLSS